MGINRRGFTLVEVLLTSVVLAFGTLLLHQTYLRLADYYGRYISGMRVEGFIHDKLWEGREAVVYFPENGPASASGSAEIDGKTYDWRREATPMSGPGLYSISVSVAWTDGGREAGLTRQIYAYHREIK